MLYGLEWKIHNCFCMESQIEPCRIESQELQDIFYICSTKITSIHTSTWTEEATSLVEMFCNRVVVLLLTIDMNTNGGSMEINRALMGDFIEYIV